MLTTYILRMRNNNLEITIAGSSCRPQKKCKNTKWFKQMVIYFTYRGDVIHFRDCKHPARGVDLVSVDF